MTRRIILTAGTSAHTRLTAARVLARETRWPLLDIDTLSGPLARHILGDATGQPENRASMTYRTLVAPAQLQALLEVMWAQVEADVPGAILTAPFTGELADENWLHELNYDLALHGYEAVVVWVQTPGEQTPTLDPEHYLLGRTTPVEDLFADATAVAVELRS